MDDNRITSLRNSTRKNFDALPVNDAHFDFTEVDGFLVIDDIDERGEDCKRIQLLYKGYTFKVDYDPRSLKILKGVFARDTSSAPDPEGPNKENNEVQNEDVNQSDSTISNNEEDKEDKGKGWQL